MGLAPPGPGLRPAGQGIGQFPQREILRFPRPEVQHRRREIRLVRDCRPPWKDAFLACWQRLCSLPARA
jgi:hypothetical protein